MSSSTMYQYVNPLIPEYFFQNNPRHILEIMNSPIFPSEAHHKLRYFTQQMFGKAECIL